MVLVDRHAFAKLDRSRVWEVDFLQVLDSARHVAQFRPADVVAVRTDGCESSQFWPPVRRRRRSARTPAGGAWAAVADREADDGSGDEDATDPSDSSDTGDDGEVDEPDSSEAITLQPAMRLAC